MQTLKGNFLNKYIDDNFYLRILSIILYPNIKKSFELETVGYIKNFFKLLEKDVSILKPNKSIEIKQGVNLLSEVLDSKNSSVNIIIDYDNIENYINVNSSYIRRLINHYDKIQNDNEFTNKYNEILEEIKIYNFLKITDEEFSALDDIIFNHDREDKNIISTVDVLRTTIESLYHSFSDLSVLIDDKKKTNQDLWYFSDESFAEIAEETTSYLMDDYINLKTGIDVIDDNIYGLMSSKLYLIASPTNHGKSVLMANLLYGIFKNNQMVFDDDKKDVILTYVLEDDKYEVQGKLIPIFGNVDPTIISKLNFFFNDNKDNKLCKKEFKIFFNNLLKRSIGPIINEKANMIIKEREEGATSVNDIIKDIEGLKYKGYRVKCVIIDYLEPMTSATNIAFSSEYEKQGQITKECRKTARLYKIPIVIATQTNKSAEDPSVRLSKALVADSIRKIQYCDFLIMMRQRKDIDVSRIDNNGDMKNMNDILEFATENVKNKDLMPVELLIDKAKKGTITESKWMILNKKNLRINLLRYVKSDLIENRINNKRLTTEINKINTNTIINVKSLNFNNNG